jgi:aminoglycoside 6'-N-acetyltransferase
MAGELQGDRVRLRRVADSDIARLTEIVADPELARWWGDNDEDDIRMEVSAPRVLPWAIEVEDQVSGLVVATEEPDPDYRSVELDIFLAAPLHDRGLGADALRTALRHLFEERDHHRALMAPAADNERAIRCYTRVGFRPVGIMRQADRAPDGRWRDALLMDLLAAELR